MKSLSPRTSQVTQDVRQTFGPAATSGAHAQSNLAVGSSTIEEQLDLREIWRKLWRSRRLIALVTVVGTLVGLVGAKQLTPTYTATSKIMLESRERQIFEAEAVLPSLVMDEDIIAGQIEVLRSRELARTVADVLNLRENPEFNASLVEDTSGGWIKAAKALASHVESQLRTFTGGANSSQQLGPDAADARERQEVVDAVLDGLEVGQVGESPVIEVQYTAEEPATAARLANSVAEAYITEQLDLKSRETREASEWLDKRIADLRAEVEDKERQIETLRSEAGILEGGENDISVATQQMSELASERVKVIMERQRAESLLQRNIDGEMLKSPVIQDMLLREEELRREIAQKSSEYGPNHPMMVNLQESLRGLQGSFAVERQRVLSKLESDVESARQRETELENSLEELAVNMHQANEKQVAIRALEREVSARRTLLESFLVRAQETNQQQEILQPDSRIISYAEIPDAPGFPNTKVMVLLAFCGSAFAGVSLAYVIQSLDNSFRTADQVRDVLGMRVLQMVPALRRRRFHRVEPADSVIDEPHSAFAESIRNLFLDLYAVRTPPKVVLFTSSVPREGKTSLTLALGRFLASTERSVLVIDCDLRRPSVHEIMEGEPVPGLVEHLRDGVPLDDTIQEDAETGLRFIAAGSSPENAIDLLGSNAMHAAISKLSRSFDMVLLDTAPLLAVAETRVLQSYADKAVLILRWQSTAQGAAKEAVRLVEESAFGFQFAGVVLNAVELESYQYYDEGAYYAAVKSYYQK